MNNQTKLNQEPKIQNIGPIIWSYPTQWHTITNQLTYPRPQGNLPMFGVLVPSVQSNLIDSYYSVLSNQE